MTIFVDLCAGLHGMNLTKLKAGTDCSRALSTSIGSSTQHAHFRLITINSVANRTITTIDPNTMNTATQILSIVGVVLVV
ncbi:hypothetical protein PFISCL1PPCAC_21467 [Pristionchus fissidentatus]|uniref:Uncharacterized protein n=1 Tax=Pristionchus fissidentatus TaxID=1538716 RepID=A0AAV5WES9_9BILA|nr:hypothetical protein PFISCL1PPCAC_21467 [Pristionchus fissidentatus]